MTTQTHAIARPVHLSPAKLILWVLALIGLVAAVLRYMYGMGAISNMSNAYSFGLWISFDLLCGVATAAGAFTVCASVYILGQKQFTPLVRPSVLTGFLGYLMVIVSLLVDVGRPERLWHMIIYWNPHSPLFEVGLCVMTYTTVLFFEFVPVVFEGWGWHRAVARMHKISIFFVILGVVLSTAHQSSLGSLFLVMADKLDPLWHSPLLPIFFFLSAICVGLAMCVFESSISTHAYGRKPEVALLSRLAKALPWLLGLYLALKLGELAYAGELGLLFKPGLHTVLFWTELLGGVTLPMILLAIPKVRQNETGLITGAVLVIAGLMLNRFDVGLIAWTRPAGATYFPALLEFGLSFGVIAAGVLTYDWVARHFPLFAEEEHEGKEGSTHAA